jgi:hypothetical protein
MSTDQITQLARTFSTACKDAAEKIKVQTYTAPIVLSVVTVLLSSPIHGGGWSKR